MDSVKSGIIADCKDTCDRSRLRMKFHNYERIVSTRTLIRYSVLILAVTAFILLTMCKTENKSCSLQLNWHASRDWLDNSETVVAVNENMLRCKGEDMGCFSLFSKSLEVDQNKTFSSLDLCLETCFKSYDYGGYSNGKCFCSNSLENIVANKTCNAACSSDIARSCLAISSITIYRKTITCQYGFSEKNLEETKIGCMELPSKRYGDMVLLTMPDLTVQQCIIHCENRHYVYAVFASSRKLCICSHSFSLFKSAEGMRKIIQTCPDENQRTTDKRRTHLYPVYQTTKKDNFCEPKKFLKPRQGPMTVLASLPGSGNTWLRHLIEVTTGIYTGSVYYDKNLYKGGMFGEILPYNSGRTIVIKDHGFKNKKKPVYDSAILLIRNFFDACLAEFTRLRSTGHTNTIDPADFKKKEFEVVSRKLRGFWLNSIKDLLKNIDHVLVVYYENVMHDPVKELRRIMEFLPDKIVPRGDVLEKKLMCMVQDLTGNFKRKSKHLNYNPFDDKLRSAIVNTTNEVNAVLIKSNQPPLPETYFEYRVPDG